MSSTESLTRFQSTNYSQQRTQIHALTKARMVLLPGGVFRMGCDTGGPAEQPAHEVSLDPFWIDVNPVTNSTFAQFVAATGYVTDAERAGEAWGYKDGQFTLVPGLNWKSYSPSDRADHPVVLITWHDAIAYSEWAGLRLLSEAEWEYCARGGADGHDFPWGDQYPDGTQSNFARAAAEFPPTNPVGLMGVNPYGVADLVGNVWQWCADWFDQGYYACGSFRNPIGPEDGCLKVRRGGAWNVIQGFRLRCSNRGAAKPETAAPNLGFRCATRTL